MGIFDSVERGIKGTLDSAKGFVSRHPALTGAVAGAGAGSIVPGVGTIVGAMAGAAIGYHVGRDDDQKAPDEKKS